MKFSRDAFEQFLITNSVIGYHKNGITLKSGTISHWYANFRALSVNFAQLESLVQYVCAFIVNTISLKNIDGILGVPEGARLLGHEVQRVLVQRALLPDAIVSVRETHKKHGHTSHARFSNGYIPNTLIVIEDVVTTGGSLINLITELTRLNIEVRHVVGLLDRLELDHTNLLVREKLQTMGIAYHTMSDASVLKKMALGQHPTIQREFELQYAHRSDLTVPYSR